MPYSKPLPTAMEGMKRVIPTDVKEPSMLGAFADVFANVAQTAGNEVHRYKREEAKMAADAKKAEGDAAMDSLAAGVWSNLKSQQIPAGVHPDAQGSLDELKSAQAAEEQGRMPKGSYRLKLESFVSGFMRDNPEYIAESFAWLNDNGVDHYLFRDAKNQIKNEESEAEREQKRLDEFAKAADEAGLTDPDTPFEERVRVGQNYRRILTERAETTFEIEMMQKKKTMSREEQTFIQGQTDDKMFQSFGAEADLHVNQLFQSASRLISAAGSDEERLRILHEIAPKVGIATDAWITKTLTDARHRMTPEGYARLESSLKAGKQRVTDLFAGDLTQYKQTEATLKHLRNTVGLDVAEAMPVLTTLRAAFGDAMSAQLMMNFVNDFADAGTIQAIRMEARGLRNITDPEQGRVRVMNMIALLKGEKKITDFTPEEAKAKMPGLVKIAQKGVADVATNDTTPQYRATVGNAYGQLINAAVEMTPRAPTKSIVAATQALTSNNARVTLAKLRADGELGTSLTMGSISASAQLLEAARSMKDGTFHKVVYNEKAGAFTVAFDEKAAAAYVKKNAKAGQVAQNYGMAGEMAGLSINIPRMDTVEDLRRRIPTDVRQKLDTLNGNLNHISQLAPHDPEMPKASPLAIKALFATGKPLPGTSKGKTGKPGEQPVKDPNSDFEKAVRAFEHVVERAPNAIPTQLPDDVALEAKFDNNKWMPSVREAASEFGVPLGMALRLIDTESGMNEKATSSKGARGIMQLMPKTAAGLGVDANDPIQNIKGGFKLLRKLYDEYGNWPDAISAYHSGRPLAQSGGANDGLMATHDYVRKIIGDLG